MENNTQVNPVGKITKEIYLIYNDINNKVYVGQSKNSAVRFWQHCNSKEETSAIDNAIKKYGREHFFYKVLESGIENYNEREQYWIQYYNSQVPNGYNITIGGQPNGEDCPSAKLTNEEVNSLKQDLIHTKMSLNDIALKYNISKKQVLRINDGVSRAVPGETYPLRKQPNINGKLTEEDVDSIIDLLRYTYRFHGEIAKEYGVTHQAIESINVGEYHRRDDIEYPIRTWKSSGKPSALTYEQVTEVMDLLINTDESLSSIARKFNVQFDTISKVNRGASPKYRRKEYTYPLRKL